MAHSGLSNPFLGSPALMIFSALTNLLLGDPFLSLFFFFFIGLFSLLGVGIST